MKDLLLFFFGICFFGFACSDDDHDAVYEYHAHVHSPSTAIKSMFDTLKIDVEFESHTGKTVHHANVKIYEKTTLTKIYDKPSDTFVNATSGTYTLKDVLVISPLNGFLPGTTYIIEAKVWGPKDGEEEVVEKVEFQIAP